MLVTPMMGREYCGVINTSVGAAITNYNVSPRLAAALFPRLNAISENWSQFRFKSLSVKLVGRSSPTVTANAAMMFLPYSFAGVPSVTTEYEVKASQGSVTVPAHKTATLNIPCTSVWLSTDTNAGVLYAGALIGRLYLYVSATATAGDGQWDMYVNYSIEFRGQAVPSSID